MNSRLRVLTVEDDANYQASILKVLSVHYDVATAPNLKTAMNRLRSTTFDVVVLDKHLPDCDAINVLPTIRAEFPRLAILFVTSDDNFNHVQQALVNGAQDYIIKGPTTLSELLIRIPLAVLKNADDRRIECLERSLGQYELDDLIGNSQAILTLRQQIQELKGHDAPVLITGETGTGKEVVARKLWEIESNPLRPFESINCGAIPSELIESELFGHVKGAFTSASNDRKGKFELANGGDLFLDELGDLPLSAQVKLLRAIQEKKVTPVGAETSKKVQVRIICATNKNLDTLVSKGQFREDLLYRIRVFSLETPPLKERLEDIETLTNHYFLRKKITRIKLSKESIELLKNHAWPGNVRELYNWLERAVLKIKKSGNKLLEPHHFSLSTVKSSGTNSKVRENTWPVPTNISQLCPTSLSEYMAAAEKSFFESLLTLFQEDVSKIMDYLELPKSTVYYKLTALGLDPRKSNEGTLPGLKTKLPGERLTKRGRRS